MPISFNGRARRPPQPPPEVKNVELDGWGDKLPPPERFEDDEPEGSVVIEGEPSCLDEADEIEALSDEEFSPICATGSRWSERGNFPVVSRTCIHCLSRSRGQSIAVKAGAP
jgi:hypothetical protein